MQRRGVAAAFLILALALGAPAHAAGLPDWGTVPTLFHEAWQWLASVLPGAGPRHEARPSAPGRGSGQKSLIGVNPNNPPVVPSSDADKGAGVDPNGHQ
jgi:hypothetical protein